MSVHDTYIIKNIIIKCYFLIKVITALSLKIQNINRHDKGVKCIFQVKLTLRFFNTQKTMMNLSKH